MTIALAAAFARWHFPGYSQAQEARKARFAQWRGLDAAAAWLPLSPVRRQLLVKDVKVFLRDVSQWSQLLLLMALVLVYLYNFRVLDLDRVPGMSGVIKNAYAFLNMGMAGFVMATVTVRFVFPAVSAEGPAFWIIRTAPISLRDFLWSKFWTGLVPVLALTECLVVVGNEFLNTDPFLKQVTAAAVGCMAFALVGLAAGLGARYPRFAADNPSQVAGSYGGVAFMVVAVLYVMAMIALLSWPSSVYLYAQMRQRPLTDVQQWMMVTAFTAAAGLSLALWLLGMRSGVKALEQMDRPPPDRRNRVQVESISRRQSAIAAAGGSSRAPAGRIVLPTADSHVSTLSPHTALLNSAQSYGARVSLYLSRYLSIPSSTVNGWRSGGHEVGLHPYFAPDGLANDMTGGKNRGRQLVAGELPDVYLCSDGPPPQHRVDRLGQSRQPARPRVSG